MTANRVVVKKYENRRLYDTANSRYVNLDDIARMVREGLDVQVVDATTGEDLTRPVLTQIIVENAKTPGFGFPVDMLREMVVASGRASQDGFLKYMRAMFDLYQNTYRAVTPPIAPFDFMQSFVKPTESIEDLRKRLEELEKAVKPRRARKPKG
jgi:polyhydroxyalkanoate synthesis repressor PhaR